MRRSQYKSCFSKNGKFHPLYDLTDDMLHAIEKNITLKFHKYMNMLQELGVLVVRMVHGNMIQKKN